MKLSISLLLALTLYGCATSSIDHGRALIAEGRVEEGLAVLEEAAKARYSSPETYSVWVTQRDNVVRALVREGDTQRSAGNLDAAENAYVRANRLDPNSPLAHTGLAAIERARRQEEIVQRAEEAFKRGDSETAERLARSVLAEDSSMRAARSLMRQISERRGSAELEPPKLGKALQKPITLEFRNAPLRSVFEVISRTSGINFVFDRDVRPDLRATIFVRDTSLDDIVKLLLVTNQLDRKILNDSSILIFPNTPAKQKDYQDLVVRSFYLTNADAKQTAAMIRALVKTRDLFIDDKLNLVVMKDTRDAVRLAEQLVATQDLGEPEVMLELEVLEVASSKLKEVGIRYPDAINLGVFGTGTSGTDGGTSTIPDLTELKPRDWDFFVVNPAVIINLRQTDGLVNTLANPRIRVKNREKARIHIGEKVPVITTTSTANVGVSSSVNYLEVGLKLDVEPNVYLDDEVAIKLQLEVSNILEQLNVQGTVSYRLGTRNAATTLRLHDGETQVLAGLISDEDRRSANKVPFLSDFPILGRLFRSDNDQRVKTEIVLLITPHVVRNLARPQTVQAHYPSGTEAAPGAMPLRIASTPLSSLNVQPTGGGSGAKPTPGAAKPGADARDEGRTDTELGLVVTGPPEAAIGSTFALSLGVPARNEGSRTMLRLTYDPGVLQVVSGASSDSPGVATMQLSGPSVVGSPMTVVQTQFRVTAKEPTTTQIGIESTAATDNQGRPISIDAPGSVEVTITPAAAGGQSTAPGIVVPPVVGSEPPAPPGPDSAAPPEGVESGAPPIEGGASAPAPGNESTAPGAAPPPTQPPRRPSSNRFDSEG